jgi:hypothetical protein
MCNNGLAFDAPSEICFWFKQISGGPMEKIYMTINQSEEGIINYQKE